MSVNDVKEFRNNRLKVEEYTFLFRVRSMEILRRRNRRNEPCMEEWKMFDRLVVAKHIEKHGCRPPYLSGHNAYPVCNSSKQMEQSRFDMNSDLLKFYPPLCQEVSGLDFEIDELGDQSNTSLFWLAGHLPKRIKLITQSKAIDVLAFIGNTGGYVGMILGKYNVKWMNI